MIDKIRVYLYYLLVGIISLLMLVFMPMLGSAAGLQWNLPTTAAGWIVYLICKLCSAGFNISLFHCFNKQGRLNISTHKDFLEAQRILKETSPDIIKDPRTPHQYHVDIYGKKGITIFIMTLLGTVGLSQAMLTFDWKEFIVQLIALVMGIIMGVLQMKDTESYWTDEYLQYAHMCESQKKAQNARENNEVEQTHQEQI